MKEPRPVPNPSIATNEAASGAAHRRSPARSPVHSKAATRNAPARSHSRRSVLFRALPAKTMTACRRYPATGAQVGAVDRSTRLEQARALLKQAAEQPGSLRAKRASSSPEPANKIPEQTSHPSQTRSKTPIPSSRSNNAQLRLDLSPTIRALHRAMPSSAVRASAPTRLPQPRSTAPDVRNARSRGVRSRFSRAANTAARGVVAETAPVRGRSRFPRIPARQPRARRLAF